MWQDLLIHIKAGDVKSLARAISLVENEVAGYLEFMQSLSANTTSIVIGITGPPGAGKSTITDGLIETMVNDGKKVAVLCIDPSSPFNLGALLGDRIRMSSWYRHESVYIRSLASRGAMGGLHPMIIEITDLLRAAGFDYIIIETVGVGQTEIEIAGLADTTVVVLVPESGDEIQTMKAGLMEIADIFVVNKADRPGAADFINNLRLMLAPAFHQHEHEIAILSTVASQQKGITELYEKIFNISKSINAERKLWLQAEKAYQLIRNQRMKGLTKLYLKQEIEKKGDHFNLYAFILEFV
jgi:LAO/AO transport system kinase